MQTTPVLPFDLWFCYHGYMTDPPVIPGEIIRQDPALAASAVMDPISVATHKFANILRHIVAHSPGLFKTENELRDAVRTIDTFERHLIPQRDRNLVVTQEDTAQVEDVSQRQPPRGAAMPTVPAMGPSIDYTKLAQAIILAQQDAGQPDSPVVTDEDTNSEPARDDSAN